MTESFIIGVRQACVSAIGCKSRMHYTVEALAKSKGVHREVESEGSWRQTFEPTNRNCMRRGCMGDVAPETKALHCTEYNCVYAEAT